jgi:hypothetical protein
VRVTPSSLLFPIELIWYFGIDYGPGQLQLLIAYHNHSHSHALMGNKVHQDSGKRPIFKSAPDES